MMLPLMVNLRAVAGNPGRPKQKPGMVVADKAFDDINSVGYAHAGIAGRRSTKRS